MGHRSASCARHGDLKVAATGVAHVGVKPRMAYRSDYVDVRGVRTHVLKGGRGRPLLVLHPEFGANMWSPYHDALAAHFLVLAPDHLGFGESERPEWLDAIDDLLFHYVDLLDLLHIERVSVL